MLLRIYTRMMNKKTEVPVWMIILLIVWVVVAFSSGGYQASLHKKLKEDYKDSTKVRQAKIKSLEDLIIKAEDFETIEKVTNDKHYVNYKTTKKHRKNAEKELFNHTDTTRLYNDSILANYKFRRKI